MKIEFNIFTLIVGVIGMETMDFKKPLYILLFCLFLGACTTKQPKTDHPAVEYIETNKPIHFLKGAFNPNDDLLAVSGWEGDPRGSIIYILDLSTNDLSVVSSENNMISNPAWTAEGLLSYSGISEHQKGNIFVTRYDAYAPEVFQTGQFAVWSSSGKYAAVLSFPEKSFGNDEVIEIFDLENEDTSFTAYRGSHPIAMAFDHEGEKLLISVESSKEYPQRSIYFYDIRKGELKLISDESKLGSFISVGWMPIDSWIFYNQTIDNDSRLAFYNIENDFLFVTDVKNVDYPSIDHSGQKIVFTSYGNIYTIDLDILLGKDFEFLQCSL